MNPIAFTLFNVVRCEICTHGFPRSSCRKVLAQRNFSFEPPRQSFVCLGCWKALKSHR